MIVEDRLSLPKLAGATALLLVAGACAPEADVEPSAEIDKADDPAVPEETVGLYAFDDYDVTGDSELDADELPEWFDRDDRDWVPDPESELDPENLPDDLLAERMVTVWDVDVSGAVDSVEWAEGMDVWFGEVTEPGTFADWNDDGDSDLDAEEIHDALLATGAYEMIDLDADLIVDEEELSVWMIEVFDANDDGVLDREEWQAFEDALSNG